MSHGLGFHLSVFIKRVWGIGFEFWDLGFKVLGFRVSLGFPMLGFRVFRSGILVGGGLGSRVSRSRLAQV